MAVKQMSMPIVSDPLTDDSVLPDYLLAYMRREMRKEEKRDKKIGRAIKELKLKKSLQDRSIDSKTEKFEKKYEKLQHDIRLHETERNPIRIKDPVEQAYVERINQYNTYKLESFRRRIEKVKKRHGRMDAPIKIAEMVNEFAHKKYEQAEAEYKQAVKNRLAMDPSENPDDGMIPPEYFTDHARFVQEHPEFGM